MKTCGKCGSTSLIRSALIRDYREGLNFKDLVVEVQQDPQALLLKETVRGPLRPIICGSCGFVEFYVSNPHELLAAEQEAYRRQRR